MEIIATIFVCTGAAVWMAVGAYLLLVLVELIRLFVVSIDFVLWVAHGYRKQGRKLAWGVIPSLIYDHMLRIADAKVTVQTSFGTWRGFRAWDDVLIHDDLDWT